MSIWRFSGLTKRGYEFRVTIPESDTPITMRAVASMLADAERVDLIERTEDGERWTTVTARSP